MTVPLPGPPCLGTLPAECYIQGPYYPGPNRPNVAIIDLLTGRCEQPVPFMYSTLWGVCDPCYGLQYRWLIQGVTCATIDEQLPLENPGLYNELRIALAPGACCASQVVVRGDIDPDTPWTAVLPFYAPCYNYNTHTDPACLAYFGIPCCSRTHAENFDEATQTYGPWRIVERAGPTRFTCEHWTDDGFWVPAIGCPTEQYPPNYYCPSICDPGTRWHCCFCGGVCEQLPWADCFARGGVPTFGQGCDVPCDLLARDCSRSVWVPGIRPPQHAAPAVDVQGLAPLVREGQFELFATANPVDYRPNDGCRVHYGRPRIGAAGYARGTICGTFNRTPSGPDVVSDPLRSHFTYDGAAQLDSRGYARVPIDYRPACREAA